MNGGLASARNYGVGKASGDLILCLDSDDLLSSNYIEVMIKEFKKNKDIRIVYSNGYMFDYKSNFWLLPKYNEKTIVKNNIIHCSAMYYKTDWILTGGYNNLLNKGWEDWDFWLSIINLGAEVKKINKPYFYYRIRKESMVRSMTEEYKEYAYKLIYERNKTLFIKHNILKEKKGKEGSGDYIKMTKYFITKFVFNLFYSSGLKKEINYKNLVLDKKKC
ncbi:glycosyltransferase family A protein [Photobacterium leiognathi]|uniref:glycosyltransferase family A protein n=1 Tax=Photobacterium leiognathi TaxID=553611 RepID=UPI002732305C|nr:glycosyltransferase family A protein [Photobacterium leiognathi]